MKKFHFMSSLLAIVLITTAAPLQAESNIEKAKNAAKERVNKSIKRLKRCIKGDCSKMEVLKALRDVTIAVTVLYFGGRAIGGARGKATAVLPKAARRPFQTATRPVGVLAGAAMTPGIMAKETAEQAAEAAKALYRKVKPAAKNPRRSFDGDPRY